MDLFLLYLDAAFNFIILVLGIVLVIQAKDNRIRLWWGITMLLLGMVLLYGSAEWIYRFKWENNFYSDNHYGLLQLLLMPRWFFVGVSLSLFSVSSLSPLYFTKTRFVVFYIPVLVVALVAVCYQLFNGHITEIHSISDIVKNIHQIDVQVRIFIFAVIMIVLPSYFFFPILGDWSSTWRKAMPLLYIFIGSMFFMFFYFIAYMLVENRFLFYTASMANTIPCIVFSIYFLRYENPFSYRIAENEIEIRKIQNQSNPVDVLYNKMQEYFEVNPAFVYANYSLRDLANEMHASQTLVIKAIKSGGFTGFREYINFLKIQYFKKLVKANPRLTVKELMYGCGFASRSTFYRIFSEIENTTPTEFMATINDANQ